MNINVGDYIRTELGMCKYIGKYVTGYGEQTEMYEFDRLDENLWSGDLPNIVYDCDINDIVIKSSPNIIDLIEVGDYVNGHQVISIGIDDNKNNVELYIATQGYDELVLEKDIKSIVTKEQFESMEYKIER